MRTPSTNPPTTNTPATIQPAFPMASVGGTRGSSPAVKTAPTNHRAPPKRQAAARSAPAYGSSRLAKAAARRWCTVYELRNLAQTVNPQTLADEGRAAQAGDVAVPGHVAAAAGAGLPVAEALARLDVGRRVLGAALSDRAVGVSGLARLTVGVALCVDGRAAERGVPHLVMVALLV